MKLADFPQLNSPKLMQQVCINLTESSINEANDREDYLDCDIPTDGLNE